MSKAAGRSRSERKATVLFSRADSMSGRGRGGGVGVGGGGWMGYDCRFEGLGEGTRQQRVVYNGCNVGKKSVETLIEERSWKRVRLTRFDDGLPDDVLDSSLRNRMKYCKGCPKNCESLQVGKEVEPVSRLGRIVSILLAKKSEKVSGIQIYQVECLRCYLTAWR